MQVDMAILSILAVVIVFVIGAFKQNPLHLGILGMFVAFVIGKAAGIADTTIMGFFPTTLFVRVFGIMFFFAIAQANGAIELLAKKMIAKFGANARLMPFVLFYVGVILGSIGINSLAGMAILGGIGVSLSAASGADPLLYGMAGGYGIACGCYSPINEYTANIISACETAELTPNLVGIYLFCLVAFSISFAVIYFCMGGFKVNRDGTAMASNIDVLKDLPAFSRGQIISLVGIIAVIALVVVFGIDVGWAGICVAVVCILLGACKCGAAMNKVSLGSLMLICGMGTLINLVSELGGFEVMSNLLASVMSTHTVAPLMCITASILSLFTISRLVVITLIPTLPGILAAIPTASVGMAITATCAGAFASCVGPLSACGALVMSSLGQQYGEKEAQNYFTKQMVMGIVGMLVVAAVCWGGSYIGVFGS